MRNVNRGMLFVAVIVGWATADAAYAAKVRVQNPFVEYHGAATSYDTLADAQSETEPTGTVTVQRRDLNLFQRTGDWNQVMTWWTPTVDPNDTDGTGNPNNVSDSFIQFQEQIGVSPASQTTMDGFWTDPSFSQFEFSMSGVNALSGTDHFARFNDQTQAGSTFHSYELNLTLEWDGGVDSPIDLDDGFWGTQDRNTGASGTFSAIFETTNPDQGPFFVIDLDLDFDPNQHWAVQNVADDDLSTTTVTGTVIPSPTAALGALGIAGLGLLRRRRA